MEKEAGGDSREGYLRSHTEYIHWLTKRAGDTALNQARPKSSSVTSARCDRSKTCRTCRAYLQLRLHASFFRSTSFCAFHHIQTTIHHFKHICLGTHGSNHTTLPSRYCITCKPRAPCMVTWIIRQPISPLLHIYKLRSQTSRSSQHNTLHNILHLLLYTAYITPRISRHSGILLSPIRSRLQRYPHLT